MDDSPPSLPKRPPGKVEISGLGTRFPSVYNGMKHPIRLTFTVAMSEEQRSVEIGPREHFPFHSHDGKLRADFIEVVR